MRDRWIGSCLGCLLLGALPASGGDAADHATAGTGLAAIRGYVDGLEGERREAGEFLLEHLPETDRGTLPVGLFRENLERAFVAREGYRWTRELPRDRFFNEVLPHAVANEARDPWRLRLGELFAPHLGECRTVRDAAKVVGAKIGTLTGVRYDKNRDKACQSPAESMASGTASCTGLSILMVDALRAAGVPARLAAIPMWGSMEGNHTWVEVHDGEGWQATDYGGSPKGWNKGWAIARCAYCDPGQPIHMVFATSYRGTGIEFPTIWDWDFRRPAVAVAGPADLCRQQRGENGELSSLEWVLQRTPVPGVDRTAHYIELAGGRKIPIPKGMACVVVRAFLAGSQTRVDVPVRATRDGTTIFEGRTACEAQDLNDSVRIVCPPGELEVAHRTAAGAWSGQMLEAVAGREVAVRIEMTEEDAGGVFDVGQRRALAAWFRSGGADWPGTVEWPVPADAGEVGRMRDELWSIFREAGRGERSARELGSLPPKIDELMAATKGGRGGLRPGSLTLGEHRMPFVLVRKESSPPPESGRALFICLHGGGRNDKAEGPHSWDVNTREWQSQARLAAEVYAGEGIFFVPRMADDRLGRWWHANVQDAVDLVVTHGLREWGVDPDRVYLMGISEGAYGTQILGPFMADRFGGANAMAGGVGDDVPAENLRNLAFRTDVGENDTMFDRVGLARKFHARMDAARGHSGGYPNHLEVQAGRGHGIDYAPGGNWMIAHRRDPRPDTVVWTAKPLDGRRRDAFYWLALDPPDDPQPLCLAARLDRGRNSVAITATTPGGDPLGGLALAVMLDDTMLDLAKPVTVTCNGEAAWSGTPERSVESLARTLAGRGDPRLSFPVVIRIRN